MEKKVMSVMSVTRALAELKRLDDKIARANTSVFVGVQVGNGTNAKVYNAQGTVDKLKTDIQSAFDTVTDLFKTRSLIKGKIVQSNAVTVVKIGELSLTVAEAIELKRSIESKRNFLATLKRQHLQANQQVQTLNAQLEAAIDSNLKTIYASDKSKVDGASYDLIAKPLKATKEASFIDPQDIVAQIAKIEEEISIVDTELDFTLSESNSRVTIEI